MFVRCTEEVRAERAGAGEAQDPSTGCQPDPNGSAGSCNTCEVTIGGTAYCSKCNEPNTYAPVNGQCEDVSQNKAVCAQSSEGTYTQCAGTAFKYKDGCYQASEGKPGYSLCVLAAQGVCTQAADGYFVPTGAANTDQSVIACDDEAGVAVGGNTYKGIANCQECAAPDAAPGARADTVATCTRCVDPKYLKDNTCVENADACGTGYAAKEDSKNGNRCIKCDDATSGGIADCAQCTAITSLTRSGAPLVTCSKCNGKKVRPDKKGCIDACPANSSDNNGVCECVSGYVPDTAGTGCTQNTAPQCTTPGCKACDNPAKDSEVCTECNESKYLTPTNQCVDDCGKLGSYYAATDNKCKKCGVANCEACNEQGKCSLCKDGFYGDSCSKCDSSCKNCSGSTASDCTACPAGKALTYGSDGTKGTCGNGCTTGTGNGACKTCGLTVEGTAYCSACATDSEYPQNGVCSSATSRTAATCKTNSVSNGACTSCNNGFFLMDGGCYETSRYPGKSVCTTVASSGGTCQTAAPGYKVDSSGTLVTCPEGCKTCSDASTCTACADGYVKLNNAQTCTKCDASCLTCETNASTCTACASGHYLSGSTCTSCESNSGSVTGVKGCASCAAPTGSTGPVLCYLVEWHCWAPLLMCLWVCLHCCSCHAYRQPPAGCVTW
ncbi:Variant-specific surface protein [Giardia duodenalis]|uniref:Variant-specific surface protein n=1 Tax=Giardia intestinalis TaxID=5741 RepID=V6TNL3_GIAIN|nr:Variant-specific surface protein [Giardia intestinalis]